MANVKFVLRKEGEPGTAGLRPLLMLYGGYGTTVGYVRGWSPERGSYTGYTTLAKGRFEADSLGELKGAMVAHVEGHLLRIAETIAMNRRASR